jgi:replicative DNA helicase
VADVENETVFVATFWRTISSDADRDRSYAWEAMAAVTPEMLESESMRVLYDNLRVRFSEGETTELTIVLQDVAEHFDYDTLFDVLEAASVPPTLNDYAKVVVKSAHEREFGKLCSTALDYLAGGKVKDGGKAAAEKMALRLMSIYTSGEGTHGFKTRDQVVREARDRAANDAYGVTVPWSKLENECGPWIPGELIGVTAYSGGGKSTFAGNLFSGFIDAGVPCIPFSTEMGSQWMDRVVAARARVEQWRAEKQRWSGAHDQREKFIEAYEAMRNMEWLMVERMDISPAEMATAIRVLRKRWDGPVVVLVDHMHRLRYDDEADKEAGKATLMLKNLTKDLGIVTVALFQPRKPENGALYGPVAGHQIRGHSMIWNELDVHLAPFRAWVKTNTEHGLTPWGTVCCDYEGDKVKFAKPDSDGSKLDDEHVYIKVDKRRVGGEGPVVCLNYDKPSGRIYEFQMNAMRGVA